MHIIALYTLNYYEDKCFISLFVRFKHTFKIYNHPMYTQFIIKKKKKNGNKSFEMYFLRDQF